MRFKFLSELKNAFSGKKNTVLPHEKNIASMFIRLLKAKIIKQICFTCYRLQNLSYIYQSFDLLQSPIL